MRQSPALGVEKRPGSDPRPPPRDKSGARKALLQWAQAATKQQVSLSYLILTRLHESYSISRGFENAITLNTLMTHLNIFIQLNLITEGEVTLD